MSVYCTKWVHDLSRSRGNDRLVLGVIAEHAHHDGRSAWPSYDTLAEKARVSRRTAINAVARLQELGEVGVIRSAGRRSNRYWLPMYVDDVAAGRHKGPPNSATSAPLTVPVRDTSTVQRPSPNSATSDTPTVQRAAPEQSFEQPSQNSPFAPSALETASPLEELALKLADRCGFALGECRSAVQLCHKRGYDTRTIIDPAVNLTIDKQPDGLGYFVNTARKWYEQRCGESA